MKQTVKNSDVRKAIAMFKKAFSENRNNYKAKYQVATLSEDVYKDKKIAYKHYEDYINLFEKNDSLLTDFAKNRIKAIKKYYFQKGEILE